MFAFLFIEREWALLILTVTKFVFIYHDVLCNLPASRRSIPAVVAIALLFRDYASRTAFAFIISVRNGVMLKLGSVS